jgi:hypothetical protein
MFVARIDRAAATLNGITKAMGASTTKKNMVKIPDIGNIESAKFDPLTSKDTLKWYMVVTKK